MAGVPRSTFYYQQSYKAEDKYSQIRKTMNEIHLANNKRYGYRRMTAALTRKGYKINHKTTYRLMKEEGLYCTVRIKRYSSYRGEIGKKAPNLLDRDFTATAVNQKWATDITEFHLFGKKIFLSPIIDLYNGEIISYTISDHPRFNDVMTMLSIAFDKIPDGTNLILHSDQGWQYRMKPYHEALINKGIIQSMSRKGNCLDNAIIEGFFGHLKAELLYNQSFESVDHFVECLRLYLKYYNEERLRSCLGYMTPVEYRLRVA